MRLASLLITMAIGVVVGIAITTGTLTTGQAAIAVGIGVVVWFVAYVALATVHARRFNTESGAVMGMLGRGEHDKAAAIWSGWARKLTAPAVIVAAARHNVAWTRLRRGQLREALELFAANELTNLRWLRTSQIDSVSALDRALCSALLGDLEAARHALADAGMRTARGAHVSYPPMKAFVEAVIACREGRAAEAATLLADHWPEFESMTTGDVLRPLRIVRAFAIAAEGPRAAGQVETVLANATPAYPFEYTFLAAGDWTEMAAFLAGHGLDGRRAA